MTHTFHNSLLVFNYNGALSQERNTMAYTALLNLGATLKERNIKGIFISLKNASVPNENVNLEHFVTLMDKLSQKIGFTIALGDYKKETFSALKKLSSPTQVKLFQDLNSAVLFLNPQFFKKKLTILLFDEDKSNADKLTSALLKLDYSITHAKSIQELKEKALTKAYDMTITQNCLNLAKSNFLLQPSLSLSKELIMNLPVFIDTAVDSLVTITGLEAQKIKHAIKPFDAKIDTNVLIASMKFKGDLSGNFFLLFPRPVACSAIEAMLGESIDIEDTPVIVDGVAELCNIITGAAKVIFSNKKMKVLFELPKTYLSLSLALNDATDNNGIWIEMQLQNKPFYMFLTR